MLETASAGSGATGIAEAVVATKLPNSTVVAHASISLDMCVSSLKLRPCLQSWCSFQARFRRAAEQNFRLHINFKQPMISPETFIFLSNYRSTARERLMVEYVVISVISLVLGFVLGYAVRAAISARKRRKASRYDARQSWADPRRS